MRQLFKKTYLIILLGLLAIPALASEISITLEFAKKHEERAWGLMKRSSIPENHGMLFFNPQGSIWMFNTLIDLSVAFLDKEGKIIEITELKAYPEMMDPKRPVAALADMAQYPPQDPVIQFFSSKSYRLPSNTYYALEMNKGWFEKHQIRQGDRVLWNLDSSKGTVIKQ